MGRASRQAIDNLHSKLTPARASVLVRLLAIALAAHDDCCPRLVLRCALTCTALHALILRTAGGERGCSLSSSARLLAHHACDCADRLGTLSRNCSLLARGRLEGRKTATALNSGMAHRSILLHNARAPSLHSIHLHCDHFRCHPGSSIPQPVSLPRAERNPTASQRPQQMFTLLLTKWEDLAHSERAFALPRNPDAPEAALA
ncbi:uncharacterized protein M421DRAFT_329205 [Didymella exigua CBS 183.55]|uniref:Uncharacterized protein n=1 Tax=Didymella exigua CBS 183.55 TaxID=1150837 RepID=A0A6A5RBP1_9PLEO|nr:uncharacterized protein M421DRAFT_329205 [Didymella exigua CBS 183.55]KAF1923217.1 hypothetical protein M421DRAFT_329205 [Didymella exigua CBS 183.55]